MMDMDIDPYRAALESITAIGAVATVLIKSVVDAIKFAFPNMPKSATPGVAVLVGIVVLLLLSVAASVVFTWTLLTQIVLASVVGSLAAIGMHRLHDKADEARQTAYVRYSLCATGVKRGMYGQLVAQLRR